MFSFFKSSIEKDLEKLGFSQLIKGYKQKVHAKEFSKQQYNEALKQLHKKHFNQINNLENVNVATRQTFDDDELLTPLNLQNIQDEYIDIDFLYSSLFFEFNSNKRIHTKALNELEKILATRFPNAVVSSEDLEKVKQIDTHALINDATIAIDSSTKDYLKAVFSELKNRT